MVARGRWGGLLAGLGFMLPGLVLMLVAGWLYMHFMTGNPALIAAFLGVQIVVLAIILRAVVRIGHHIIEDRLLAVIAVASFAATLVNVPFWIPLIAAGLIYTLSHRWLAATAIAALSLAAALLVQSAPQSLTFTVASGGDTPTLMALFLAGLKGGLLTFGGAYTAIPYVRNDTVGRGWLNDATFLDGVALAGLLPAPLVIFATFAGYVVGGFGGALMITAGMFLPAFAFSLVFFERLEAVVENPAFHRLLAGVAAAVVGIIAATLVQLVVATVPRVPSVPAAMVLFVITLFLIWRLKGAWVTPALVAAGGLAGWLTLN
jgi:chromate transporter